MSQTRVLREADELARIAETGLAELGEHATTTDAIAWAAKHFSGSIAVACSMADGVLPALVADQIPGVDVIFLDTGYHFSDTLVTRDLVDEALDINIVDVRPELTVAEQNEKYGKDLFARDPQACCRMRKVEPLRKALSGYEAWITGVRRDEAPTRANTPVVEWDATFGLVKINPLVDWSFDQLLGYADDNRIPVNLLVSAGYPSIGCEPCTKPVAEGEDPRSGRWSGFAKTECGLHNS